MDIIAQMEAKCGCRYERPATAGVLRAFPVTHRIDGSTRAAWAHISTGDFRLVNWAVYDADGDRLVYGCERNYAGTAAGKRQAIRWALGAVRCYGATVRVRRRPGVDTAPCTRCAPSEGATNHVPGHIFVGWGHGWQPCTACDGTGAAAEPR